jgi:hypothetical protein
MIIELIGFIMIVVSIIILFPYTKERNIENEKVPFDKNRLKIK